MGGGVGGAVAVALACVIAVMLAEETMMLCLQLCCPSSKMKRSDEPTPATQHPSTTPPQQTHAPDSSVANVHQNLADKYRGIGFVLNLAIWTMASLVGGTTGECPCS